MTFSPRWGFCFYSTVYFDLTACQTAYVCGDGSSLTTKKPLMRQASRGNVQDWMKRKFVAPKLQRLGNVGVRLWTASDIARLKQRREIYQEKRPKK